MLVLGVDPGSSGGAVERIEGRVAFVAAWTPVAAGIRLRRMTRAPSPADAPWREQEHVVATLWHVGRLVAGHVGYVDALVLEGLEPPGWHGGRRPGRRAVEDLIVLAEGAGELLGGLRGIGPLHRPKPEEWRARIGAASVSGDRAEAIAIGIARREGWLPRWTVKEQGAVAEAGAMTLWPNPPAVEAR
jgi:hypothetical protein